MIKVKPAKFCYYYYLSSVLRRLHQSFLKFCMSRLNFVYRDCLKKEPFLQLNLLALDVRVYKCVGHQYSINEKEIVNTLYIAIPVRFLTTVINVGDIMVGNHSNGFLETVNEVRQDQGRTFIHTELTRCSGNIRIRFAF